jgi:hypothetical protein
MRKIFKLTFALLFIAQSMLFFSACNEGEDLMTDDVKTGGLVDPMSSFFYKLNETTDFDVTIDIPKGPGIVSIEVYKTYTGEAEILEQVINVASANKTGDITKVITFNYAALIDGLVGMPADEGELTIGDKWTLRYEAIMEDGRSVVNEDATTIGVANFFAGIYDLTTYYFHPTAGGTYPDDPYGGIRVTETELLATTAFECTSHFGVWTDDLVYLNIVDDVLTVTYPTRGDAVAGDPNDATKVSNYDPATGIIEVYYHYYLASGPRIFWLEYVPQ